MTMVVDQDNYLMLLHGFQPGMGSKYNAWFIALWANTKGAFGFPKRKKPLRSFSTRAHVPLVVVTTREATLLSSKAWINPENSSEIVFSLVFILMLKLSPV